jgi:hypothetical protein
VDGRQRRQGRLKREAEPRAWGSIALAIGIAALGVQVGRLTWHTPAEPAPVTALPWDLAPKIPLEPALGHRIGMAPPGIGRLARAVPTSPPNGAGRGASENSSATSPTLLPPGPIIGPIAPPGPGYVGKPLPLPNRDQVRFLLRHDPLALVPPVDPLRIAPGSPAPPPASPGSPPPRKEPAATAVLAHRQEMGRPPRVRAAPPRDSQLIARALAGSLIGIDAGELQTSNPAAPTPSTTPNGPVPAAVPVPVTTTAPSHGDAKASKPDASDGASVDGGSPPAASGPNRSSPPATGTAASVGTSRAPETPSPVASGEAKPVAGETQRPRVAPEAPLRLQLTIDGTSGGYVAPGQMALVRVAASAPCHVAVYRIDARGRITALLSLSGAARMKPASAFSLAVKAGSTSGPAIRERVVAIGSRRPLSPQEAQLCLRAFPPAGDDTEAIAPQPVQEMPLAAALQALADYAGRQPAGLTATPGGATTAGATCAVASFVVGGPASRESRRLMNLDE